MTLAYAYETGRLIHRSRHFSPPFHLSGEVVYIREYTIQYTAAQRTAQRSALQHTTAHYNDVTHYNIVQHTTTYCYNTLNTLHHASTRSTQTGTCACRGLGCSLCTALQYEAPLYRVAVCCSVLQSVAVSCSLLQCVAVCRSCQGLSVACCSVLQSVAAIIHCACRNCVDHSLRYCFNRSFSKAMTAANES